MSMGESEKTWSIRHKKARNKPSLSWKGILHGLDDLWPIPRMTDIYNVIGYLSVFDVCFYVLFREITGNWPNLGVSLKKRFYISSRIGISF